MLEIKNVVKRYQYVKILDHISLTLPECGLIAIVGPSGCGKSTLLNVIGGIDKEYQGKILYNGKRVKCRQVGYLFQSFHLIQWLKVKNNIHLPLFYRRQKYLSYKHDLGLSTHFKQYVNTLSLGQRQRAAFLRAMSFYPDILLCDEPTASLDHKHGEELMMLLKEESKRRLVIFVSHDMKLVSAFSDEIYEMKDGKILNYHKLNTVNKVKKVKQKLRIKKPKILLSLLSMKENKSRMIQMMAGLILSLTTILLTLSLTQGFHKQLNTYIESMVPPSSISFRLKNHQNISHIFVEDERIKHVHLYPDEYELLGISDIAERYSQGISTVIYDDSSFIKEGDLLHGRKMSNEYEVVISKMTAVHFLNSNDIESLINKEVMIWFKYLNEVKGTIVKIVGIVEGDSNYLYYCSNSHLELIKHIYSVDDVKCTYGLIYVQDSQKDIEYLEKTYREYEFKEVGKSTRDSIDSFMEKANYVLLMFSTLAIISSLFLIGEVMFLEVMCKRKDIAIMKCFGANTLDVICYVLYQSFIIYLISIFSSFFSFLSFKNILNTFFETEMLVDIPLIVVDVKMVGFVYVIGFILLIFSVSIPLLYAIKVNTVESLKINS